jgi:hypothetical protein
MKLLDVIVASAAAYSAYKIVENKKGVADLRGDYNFKISPRKAENKNLYKLDDSIFRYLEDPVQTVLLQCFAHDYTAPRMIEDESLYNSAVAAANKTGAPCAWVQIVALTKPRYNLENAAENMLKFCDNFIMKHKDGINLEQLRSGAIACGIS